MSFFDSIWIEITLWQILQIINASSNLTLLRTLVENIILEIIFEYFTSFIIMCNSMIRNRKSNCKIRSFNLSCFYIDDIKINFVLKFVIFPAVVRTTYALLSFSSIHSIGTMTRKERVYLSILHILRSRSISLSALKAYNRGFNKLSTIQECQYCQLCFSCAIWNELDQWSLQPYNIILFFLLIYHFTFTIIIWWK